MNSRLVVSTECPTCGAPLDFSEGSNAIQCGHCRSRLLVTGRKQLLSYYIPPKLDVHRAVAKALLSRKEGEESGRAIAPQLYFIPYYRLTGHDFIWARPELEPKADLAAIDRSLFVQDLSRDSEPAGVTLFALFEMAWDFGVALWRGGEEKLPERPAVPKVERPPADVARVDVKASGNGVRAKQEERVFDDRYLEKNFIASDLKGWGAYSLGIRPAVLRLELFRKEVLEAQGRIVGVTLSAEEAWRRGLKEAEPERVVGRELLGRVLALIYFPFWVVEIEQKGKRELVLLDAVSEAVLQSDLPVALRERLDAPAPAEGAVIGFRPLACPNCGWDLPLAPEEIVFVCASCGRGWQISGSDLAEVPCRIAAPADPKAARYLPFWSLTIPDRRSAPFLLPAFRCRRLKLLADLASRLAAFPPSDRPVTAERPALQGCYYDAEDAARLARFVMAWEDKTEETAEGKALSPPPSGSILTWIPFSIEGNLLRDPITGFTLPSSFL